MQNRDVQVCTILYTNFDVLALCNIGGRGFQEQDRFLRNRVTKLRSMGSKTDTNQCHF